MTEQTRRLKIVLVGNSGVGKTTFLTRYLTEEFTRAYVATLGVEVHPVSFHTTRGDIVMDVWDTAGQEYFMGLQDAYNVDADACIAMFDGTNTASLGCLIGEDGLIARFQRLCPGKPVILVRHKCDLLYRKPSKRLDQILRETGATTYFDMSSKSNYNYERPFLTIIQHVLGPDTMIVYQETPVEFVESDDEAEINVVLVH